MQYLISFLEGIITFISPCLLPMLPIYVSYFAGGEENKKKTFKNAIGFFIGFSSVFIILGAFAGSIGKVINEHTTIVNVVTGLIVILFGLNYIGLFKTKFLQSTHKLNYEIKQNGFFSTIIFGIIFSIGWTPCVGVFLGSALVMASQKGSVIEGIIMLIAYSMGLGIPFVISAIILDKLKGTFQFIKNHYKIINLIAGIFLVIVGLTMMTGTLGYLLALLS